MSKFLKIGKVDSDKEIAILNLMKKSIKNP